VVPPEYRDDLVERNDANSGKSQTTHAHFYHIRSQLTKNKTILVVDTPGLASSGVFKKMMKTLTL
jgi:putative ribosome biogenesis GTPase RsgA